jgi:hypothetical protein
MVLFDLRVLSVCAGVEVWFSLAARPCWDVDTQSIFDPPGWA